MNVLRSNIKYQLIIFHVRLFSFKFEVGEFSQGCKYKYVKINRQPTLLCLHIIKRTFINQTLSQIKQKVKKLKINLVAWSFGNNPVKLSLKHICFIFLRLYFLFRIVTLKRNLRGSQELKAIKSIDYNCHQITVAWLLFLDYVVSYMRLF